MARRRFGRERGKVCSFLGGCTVAEPINQELFLGGASYNRPTIWLYGQGDYFYSIEHSKKNFVTFENAGVKGKFVEFDEPAGVGHNVIHHPDLWIRPVSEYLDTLPA